MHVTKNVESGLRRMYTKRDSDFKNRIFISALFFKQFISVHSSSSAVLATRITHLKQHRRFGSY